MDKWMERRNWRGEEGQMEERRRGRKRGRKMKKKMQEEKDKTLLAFYIVSVLYPSLKGITLPSTPAFMLLVSRQ